MVSCCEVNLMPRYEWLVNHCTNSIHVVVKAHAARTQHQNFSESTEEIKPLTKEEKDVQLKK